LRFWISSQRMGRSWKERRWGVGCIEEMGADEVAEKKV
jgi:hypothetical protein